jgi:hypothetical protein
MSFGITHGSSGGGLRPALGLIAFMLLLWSLLIGVQLLRMDFRHDLPLADLLKIYPLSGWQLALGELLAPTAILTCIQWLLLMVILGLFWQTRGLGLGQPERLSLGFGAALILPLLNLMLLEIPNAAALAFPAWFQSGKGGVQGIEATGQRIIFALGQLVGVCVALIPAAALFAGVFFAGRLLFALAPSILLASMAAAVVLAAEAALGIVLLGWLFNRFDVSAEQTS